MRRAWHRRHRVGATGPTGRHVVDLALQSGDPVTVLARRPEALDDLADQVTVVAGDATSYNDVVKAMIGQDVVISALGRSTSVRADDLFTRAAVAVIGAAEDVGVFRLVWLSSFGVGDKEISEKAIRSSGLDWTLVYPTMLTKDPAKGTYLAGDLMATVAKRHGATVPQIALAWLLASSPVTLAIPGTGSPTHLAENMAAGSITLTPKDLSDLA